jgi:hypothetical protein
VPAAYTWPERIAVVTRGRRPSVNEDRVFTTTTAVIILDGATQPDSSDHDGGWMADTIGRAVKTALTPPSGVVVPDPGPDLREVVAQAIKRTTNKHELHPDHAPSTTVSIARWTHATLDLLVLGDSPVVVFTRDGQHAVVTDERLSQVTAAIREAGPPPDLRSLVAGQRKRRNKPDGYWIVETDPQAAMRAITRQWPIDTVAAVLMTTDGVSNGVTKYRRPASWNEALALARRDPRLLIDIVHNVEASDVDRTRWPRTKVHDDKSVALIEF